MSRIPQFAARTSIPAEILTDLAAHQAIPTDIVDGAFHIPDDTIVFLNRIRKTRPKRRDQEITDDDNESGCLTAGEVAGFFQVKRNTVNTWEAEGRLRAFRTPARHRKFAVA